MRQNKAERETNENTIKRLAQSMTAIRYRALLERSGLHPHPLEVMIKAASEECWLQFRTEAIRVLEGGK